MAVISGYTNVQIILAPSVAEDGEALAARCVFDSYDAEETPTGRLKRMKVRLGGMAATMIAFKETEVIAYLHGGERDWRSALLLASGRSDLARERNLRIHLREVKTVLKENWAIVERFVIDAMGEETN